MYGQADNSAFGGERLSNASERQDLVTQWIGRPGPRYQTDRQNRKPSPLASGGRLFLQGQQRMIALDSYSGTVLWSVESPTVMRWNVPHDCSNWCADDDGIYVAAANQAWFVDGKTGNVARQFELPLKQAERDGKSWGYIARYKNQLLGSVVSTPAIYTQWWGNTQWFDSTGGADTHVVAGDRLFSLDPKTGDVQWNYDGMVLHPTITVMDDQLFFVEDKTADHQSAATRRISLDADQQHELVCLDVVTGIVKWRRPLAAFAGHIASLYLAGGGETDNRSLVLVASESTQSEFSIQTFRPQTGDPIWIRRVAWEANHHGKHISRPAIQGDLLYLRPEVLKLADGETIRRGFPGGHGCASYTLSTNGLFARLGETTWWDVRHDKVNRFDRIRTDCWISVVPAQGMLLSAEGGGGCSCGSWLETSLGFLPRSVDETFPDK
jgi:outer membrane protein assembly factor BamB